MRVSPRRGACRWRQPPCAASARHAFVPERRARPTRACTQRNIRIPIDNEHENHFRLRWTRRGFTEQELYDYKFGGYAFPLHEPGTYLAKQRKDNDYGYDPVLQRQFNYSGVVPFPTQDLMMIEHQWGPIAKREREHLVASDRIIIPCGDVC